MNKSEFLRQLKNELRLRNVNDIPEILADYEEHFAAALDEKTEEEIIEELGPVFQIANEYAANRSSGNNNRPVQNNNQNQTVVYKKKGDSGLFLLLIFLDVVLGIAAAATLFSLVVSLCAVSISCVVAGGIYSVYSFFIFGAVAIKFAGFFASIGVVIAGVLAAFAIKPVIKGIITLIKKYASLHKRALVGGQV